MDVMNRDDTLELLSHHVKTETLMKHFIRFISHHA